MTLGAFVHLKEFVQDSFAETNELRRVREIANTLWAHLESTEAQQLITAVNIPGRSSAHVQATFLELAIELGFRSEARKLFESYSTTALRPDYFLQLDQTGILLEVERGKTTINNMDMLDFWKCHMCESANYLFLLVPRALVQHEGMRPRNEYLAVCKRLAAFFVPRNYTNVRGLFVFGY